MSNWAAVFPHLVSAAGHEIADVATTLPDALDLVVRLDELGISHVFVDGNLSESSESMNKGGDGAQIILAIKKVNPKIKTIGISVNTDVIGADMNFYKQDITADTSAFINFLRNLS